MKDLTGHGPRKSGLTMQLPLLRAGRSIQGMAAELEKGQEDKSYKEQLRKLWLLNLDKRRLRGHLIIHHNSLKGGCNESLLPGKKR